MDFHIIVDVYGNMLCHSGMSAERLLDESKNQTMWRYVYLFFCRSVRCFVPFNIFLYRMCLQCEVTWPTLRTLASCYLKSEKKTKVYWKLLVWGALGAIFFLLPSLEGRLKSSCDHATERFQTNFTAWRDIFHYFT